MTDDAQNVLLKILKSSKVRYYAKTQMKKLLECAKKILSEAGRGNYAKERAWRVSKQATNEAEYAYYVENVSLDVEIKRRLKKVL